MSSDQHEVSDAFNRFRDALLACDTAALDGLLAPDYRGYNLQGELEDREVVLQAYRPGETALETWEVKDLRIDVFGEIGLVTGRGHVAGTWKGHPWAHHLRFCDIYLSREGAWRLYLSQATPMASF